MKEVAIIMSVVYVALLAVLLAVTIKDKDRKYYVKVKMLTSSMFIVMACTFSLMTNDYTKIKPILIAALVASWCGDLALGLYHKKKRKRYMLIGIGFFILAQILLTLFVYEKNPEMAAVDIIVPILIIPMLFILIRGFNLHTGRAKVPVVVYAFLLTLFVTKAIHVMFDMTTGYAFAVGIGAQLWWFSDYVLLFLYFYHTRTRGAKYVLHAANLLLYYTATYLITLSILLE